MSAAAPLVSLIVAMAQNGVIGRSNALPWRLPQDMKRFRSFTLGKPVLMARRTYESIGRPLQHRTNLVLTRSPLGRAWGGCGAFARACADAGGAGGRTGGDRRCGGVPTRV